MPYTPQEKLEFAIKDAKYNIGMGVGNAFNKAVDLVLNKYKDEGDFQTLLALVEDTRDKFFASNQAKIEEEIANWKENNVPGIKRELGIQDNEEVPM